MKLKEQYVLKHGTLAWEDLKRKRNPNLSDLIEKFGQDEGNRRYTETNRKRAFTLENQIKKHGVEEGTRRYNNHIEKYKNKGTLEFYTSRYGQVEGEIKYKEKNKKLSVGVDRLLASGRSMDEVIKIKNAHRNNSTISLSSFIRKHGNELGTIKYERWVSSAKNRSQRCLEYWTSRGFSQDEATAKVTKFQSKCTLVWYIEKYGDVDGYAKYVDNVVNKTKNWSKSNGPVSKLEKNFMRSLSTRVELNPKGTTSRLILQNKVVYCDYLDTKQNKIIEIYGDYWHMNPTKFNPNDYNASVKKLASEVWELDHSREQMLKNNGFDVLIIWECDIINDIIKCLTTAEKFLKE